MGTGQSKNAPDDQMRMKMENGFDDDDVDTDTLGLTERDRTVRSKSNVSLHTSERLQNAEGDEYFNKIYNKRAEKSLSSLNCTPTGVKSAPSVSKMEKDPEVAEAIAELEETFKVLGDSALPEEEAKESTFSNNVMDEHGNSESLSLDDEYSPSSLSQTDGSTRELSNSVESGMDSAPESSPCQLQYDRHLITRAGESRNGLLIDASGVPRRSSKLLDSNSSRAIGTSGGNLLYSSCGSSRSSSDQRTVMISSQSGFKNGRGSSNISNSVLMQQRKEFQRLQAADNANFRNNLSEKTTGESDSATQLHQQDWTYKPPMIEGFDIEKFKKINSIVTAKTVPRILREDDDNGYYSRSPEIPAYTKDELELIASLEREGY